MSFSNFNTIPTNNPLNTSTANPLSILYEPRDPGPLQNTFPIGTEWQNTTTKEIWKCVSTGIAGAIWQPIAYDTGGNVSSLSANGGTKTFPDSVGNIAITADGTIINVTAGTNALSIVPSATIATSFPTQSGTATPALNALTISGSSAAGTTSSGSGSTVVLGTTFAAWSGSVLTVATPGGGTTALSIVSSGAVTAPVQLKCGTGLDYTFGAGDIAPFRISQSNAGNGVVAYLYNPSTSAGSNANLSILCDGAGKGAYTSWITLTAPATTNLWQGGIYASDSSFRLSATTLGTTDALIIATTNAATFASSVTAASFTVASGGPTITSGSGAPGSTQPKGSLYLRTDGSGANDRAYIATDSAGTWTAIVTVA